MIGIGSIVAIIIGIIIFAIVLTVFLIKIGAKLIALAIRLLFSGLVWLVSWPVCAVRTTIEVISGKQIG